MQTQIATDLVDSMDSADSTDSVGLVIWKIHQTQRIAYNQFQNILRFFTVYENLLPPQVKRCAIITYKHGICELSHEFPKDLRSQEIMKY